MQEINLYDLLRFYAKNWYNILTFVIIGAIIGVAYTFYIQAPLYESKATLLAIGSQRTTSGQDSVTLNNYVSLFKSHRVLDTVIDKQNYDQDYDTLVSNTSAQNDKNTDIIRVSIATADAEKSKKLLESAIEVFRTQAKDLYGNGTLNIKVVDAAHLPTESTNVKPVMQIGLATAAGFAFGVITLFFIYDYRQTRKHDVKHAPHTHTTGTPMQPPAPMPVAPVQTPPAPVAAQPATSIVPLLPPLVDDLHITSDPTQSPSMGTPTPVDPKRHTPTRRYAPIKRMLGLLMGDGESNQRKQ